MVLWPSCWSPRSQCLWSSSGSWYQRKIIINQNRQSFVFTFELGFNLDILSLWCGVFLLHLLLDLVVHMSPPNRSKDPNCSCLLPCGNGLSSHCWGSYNMMLGILSVSFMALSTPFSESWRTPAPWVWSFHMLRLPHQCLPLLLIFLSSCPC